MLGSTGRQGDQAQKQSRCNSHGDPPQRVCTSFGYLGLNRHRRPEPATDRLAQPDRGSFTGLERWPLCGQKRITRPPARDERRPSMSTLKTDAPPASASLAVSELNLPAPRASILLVDDQPARLLSY